MMPRGPKGEKRPADVIGNAVRVMQACGSASTDAPSRSARLAALAGAGVVGGEVVARAGKATRTSAITKLIRWLMAVPSGGDAAGGVRDGGARQGNETGAGPVPLAIATTTSARAVCSRQFALARPPLSS